MRTNDLRDSVALIFEVISEALEDGRRVELRGFGAFTTRLRDSRTGRNPRTGVTVEVEAGYVPFFKMGKELRMRLNEGLDPEQLKS